MSIASLQTKMTKHAPDDLAIVLANKKKLYIPSNKVINPLLFSARVPFGIKAEGIITGTVVAMEKRDKPFEKAVFWKPARNIVKRFVVPDAYVGKVNCTLAANQGFNGSEPNINVDIKATKTGIFINYEIDPKYLACIENTPKKSGVYFPEKAFYALSTTAQGADATALYLNADRTQPFIGPIGRRVDKKVAMFHIPVEVVDMRHRAYKPSSATMFTEENYREIIALSNREHAELSKPILIMSDTSHAVHLTQGYGLMSRIAMEDSFKKAAETVSWIVGADLGKPDNGAAIPASGNGTIDLSMKVAVDMCRTGTVDKPTTLSIFQGKDMNEIDKVFTMIMEAQQNRSSGNKASDAKPSDVKPANRFQSFFQPVADFFKRNSDRNPEHSGV